MKADWNGNAVQGYFCINKVRADCHFIQLLTLFTVRSTILHFTNVLFTGGGGGGGGIINDQCWVELITGNLGLHNQTPKMSYL